MGCISKGILVISGLRVFFLNNDNVFVNLLAKKINYNAKKILFKENGKISRVWQAEPLQ